jgi:hypothetical protein
MKTVTYRQVETTMTKRVTREHGGELLSAAFTAPGRFDGAPNNFVGSLMAPAHTASRFRRILALQVTARTLAEKKGD